MSLNVISHEVLITSLDIIQMMVVSNITELFMIHYY